MTTMQATAAMIEPGIYADIGDEAYHTGPGISKSGLDVIHRCPADYILRREHPKGPTPAMALGKAVHALVLEPGTFEAKFCKDEYPGSYSKEAKAWREAQLEAGRTVVQTAIDADFWDKDDWRAVYAMRDAIAAHPIASILLNLDDGKAEQSVFWIDQQTRKLCKCRPDFMNEAHNLCVDLKTTEDASFQGFGQSVSKYRYHVQDAFYRDGLHAIGRTVAGFIFVAVEKQPPYNVAVYRLGQEEVRTGRLQYEDDLAKYAKCKATDTWPGYPDEIRDLTLTQYQLRGFIS